MATDRTNSVRIYVPPEMLTRLREMHALTFIPMSRMVQIAVAAWEPYQRAVASESGRQFGKPLFDDPK